MAWNEPGNNKNQNDPWGNGGGNRGNDQGPPDLDEIIKNFQKKLGGIFGGKGGGRSGSSSGGGISFSIIIAVILIFWAASGIYRIEEAERGIVMQFGEYKNTVQSGLHWHIPRPVQKVIKVNVAKVFTISVEETMLTQDENIVDIEGNVQFRIDDPTKYLFSNAQPEATLKNAAESALREVTGKSKMDYVITQGRAAMAAEIQKLTQEIVNEYDTGLYITEVNIRNAKPPEAVKASFDDVNKAREDEVRFLNEAQAYSNEVIPKARGAAARVVQDAEAYKQEKIARANGDAKRFTSLLKEYKRAPGVTRDRLYLEMVENVYSNSTKVMIDVDKGNNLMYMPLDKLMLNAAGTTGVNNMLETLKSNEIMKQNSTSTETLRNRMPSRSRGER